MNLLDIVTKPFKSFAEREERKREERIFKSRNEAINVTEFAGKICLSVDGTPILPIDEVGIEHGDIPRVLDACRSVWMLYQKLNG